MATTDLGGRTEVGEANWQGYRATLLELAQAGGEAPALAERRRKQAAEVLRRVDDVLTEELLDSRRRCWRWVGQALLVAGEDRLWAALYASGEMAAGTEYRPGDELRFLEREDLPIPALPEDWPEEWLPVFKAPARRAPEPAGAGRGGTATEGGVSLSAGAGWIAP